MTTTTMEPVTKTPADRPGARRLGVIGLALVLIAAMDSIRNLPATATFGWSAIFFYAVAVLTYLVPVALCSAELATTVGGGMYRWVREPNATRTQRYMPPPTVVASSAQHRATRTR